jgi:hypothetical protein
LRLYSCKPGELTDGTSKFSEKFVFEFQRLVNKGGFVYPDVGETFKFQNETSGSKNDYELQKG